jgi:hypothetical protein
MGASRSSKKPISSTERKINRKIEGKIENISSYKRLGLFRKVAKRLSHQRQYQAIHFQYRKHGGQRVL